MSLVCVTGGRECCGCMRCQEEPEPIGKCEYCGEDILSGDEHYAIDGEMLHWDCLREWAEKYRVIVRGV